MNDAADSLGPMIERFPNKEGSNIDHVTRIDIIGDSNKRKVAERNVTKVKQCRTRLMSDSQFHYHLLHCSV